MDEKGEHGGRYRLGCHWQTIQGNIFLEEKEMDRKFIEEERRRQARGKRLRSYVVLGERLARLRELGLVRDVGGGLPAAKVSGGP